MEFDLTTLMVIDTDCTGSCKFIYDHDSQDQLIKIKDPTNIGLSPEVQYIFF
jgi:hypothetical protein